MTRWSRALIVVALLIALTALASCSFIEDLWTGGEPSPTEEQVPVSYDFNPEAEREVTEENYQRVLDRIERELD